MAGPRDRSRQRGLESQNQYELQDIQPSHLNPTGEGSIAESEGSYDEHDHGHPQKSRTQLLDRRLMRTYKQRSDRILETCQAESARVLRMCVRTFSKHLMMTLFIATIFCILLLLAFRGLDPRPGFGSSTGRAMGHHQVTITHHLPTVYRTITVEYNQFHGARPVHHQVPMAASSNLEFTGQVKRQDSLHPHVVTGTSTSVPGLYFMPMSITDGDWAQTQQDTHPSSRPAANAPGPQALKGSQSSGKSEPQAEPLLPSREICAPRNLSSDQADADTTSLTRWGVDILYALRRRSRRSLQLYKGSCIENACSPHKQLVSMCNTTKTIYNSFRKQECKWCWPENRRKHLEIEKHCTEVSKRAFNTLIIICGILLFCTLVVAILLGPRMLRCMRKGKVNPMIHEKATTASSVQKESKSVPCHLYLHGISRTSRSSRAATSRIDERTIRKCSPGENAGSNPWSKPVLANAEKHLGIGPKTRASSRSRLQKQRTNPLEQDIAIGDWDSHTSVPVLPPAPPASSSRVSSEIASMGQGSLLSDAGTNPSQHNIQGMPQKFPK